MAADFKPYDQSEIESIRLMLEAEAKDGNPICFEVKVDNNLRILKTNKVERFNELYRFINENSKELIISIFPDPGNNNRKEWYKYTLNSNGSLNGSELDQKLNERMKAYEDKHAYERLQEKFAATQNELLQAEDYIRILEDKLEAARVKPNHFGTFDLGKFAGTTIETIAEHHPKVLEDVPVLNGIAKVIQESKKNKPQQLSGSFEGDVSFKVKEPKEEQTTEQIEHEKIIRRLVDFIGEHFDEHQRKVLGMVIVELGENIEQLLTVAELLNIDVNARLSEEREEE